MTTQALGTYLTLLNRSGSAQFHFQNFYIEAASVWQGTAYTFMPFGFSGVTVDADGENVEAQLVFPNNALSRDWAVTAAEDAWVAKTQMLVVDPQGSPVRILHGYVGQVTSVTWDDTALSLKTSSILDAVQSNIPHRRLNRNLVGALPVTDAIRL